MPLALLTALVGCGGGGGNTLKSTVAPPPAGFAVSTDPSATNGTLSANGFNDYIDVPNIAQTTNLKKAYEATYDSTGNDDSILAVVAEFASAKDAQTFANLANRDGPFRGSRADPAVAPTISALPGIPDSVRIDPTVASADPGNDVKTYDHAVAAVKGNRAMFLDYITPKKGPVPALGTLAQQQYDRL
jgi:hypothetical protein